MDQTWCESSMSKRMKKVYFAGSVRGGRTKLKIFKKIIELLQHSFGMKVLTNHIGREDVLEFEKKKGSKHVYERDMKWLDESELLIAEVSTPSLGVGYEIARAVEKGIPVLCLCDEGTKEKLSWIIKGNTSSNFRLVFYREEADIKDAITEFLKEFNLCEEE